MSAIRFGKRSGVGGVLVLAMLLGLVGSAGGQDPTSSVPATMLRVLAERADQYRTGRQVFFVADYRFPHNVAGPFATLAEARRVQSDSGRSFGVFGPYLTRPDPASDSTLRIVRVTLTLVAPDGRRDTLALDPSRVDAMFFTMSAIDKFMIPYYTRVYGAEYASILRKKYLERPVGGCHIGSLPCYPVPPDVELVRVWDPVRGPLRP